MEGEPPAAGVLLPALPALLLDCDGGDEAGGGEEAGAVELDADGGEGEGEAAGLLPTNCRMN